MDNVPKQGEALILAYFKDDQFLINQVWAEQIATEYAVKEAWTPYRSYRTHHRSATTHCRSATTPPQLYMMPRGQRMWWRYDPTKGQATGFALERDT